MTIVDRWITIVVNGETIKGVIRRAFCSMVEVWIVAPYWCGGVRRTDFIKLKKPTRQELIEYGKNMLLSLYYSCEVIRKHKAEIVEAENEYNKEWLRLNERSKVIRENIQVIKKEIEERVPRETSNGLLRKYHNIFFRLSRLKNRLIFSYIGDWQKQIEVDNLLYTINRICKVRFMSNRAYRLKLI